VFDRDEKGVNAHCLRDVMNKLLELKYKHDLEQMDKESSEGAQRPADLGECPQISLEEAHDIIKDYDFDGDERLNFDEF